MALYERDMGAKIMKERLIYGKELMEEFLGVKFENFSEEMKIKTVELAISLYIQRERRGSGQ